MIAITRSLLGRRLIVALLTWLVPFLAVPFNGNNGTILIDPGLYKPIILVLPARVSPCRYILQSNYQESEKNSL